MLDSNDAMQHEAKVMLCIMVSCGQHEKKILEYNRVLEELNPVAHFTSMIHWTSSLDQLVQGKVRKHHGLHGDDEYFNTHIHKFVPKIPHNASFSGHAWGWLSANRTCVMTCQLHDLVSEDNSAWHNGLPHALSMLLRYSGIIWLSSSLTPHHLSVNIPSLVELK